MTKVTIDKISGRPMMHPHTVTDVDKGAITSPTEIAAGQILTIPENRQLFTYGKMTVNGKLNIIGTAIAHSLEIGEAGEVEISNEYKLINI